ncbi:recombinase family protein [Streptomyces diastaticus]|uniref:recombinase family protein n=1 Tax=Streptomyces diastaticus TaxID=1956 RepID=UPI003822D7F0
MQPQIDLYVRKSKRVSEGTDALSIRAQEARGRRWADQNGYGVRKIWRENESAFRAVERPEFEKALSAVLSDEIPALWCFAMDRFSRKGARSVIDLLDSGKRVVFDYEDLDTSRKRDRRWIIQRAEDAFEYSDRLSYNVRTTKERQRTEGKWLARPPYGWTVDKNRKLRNNPKTWPIVERIYAEAEAGSSTRAIAKGLNALRIPGPGGGKWHSATVRQIVHHPVHEGWLTVSVKKTTPVVYLHDGKRVRCTADNEATISAEKAARARRIISGFQLAANPDAPRHGRAETTMVGLCVCAGCGYNMARSGGSLLCNQQRSGITCPAPASVSITAIESYVVDAWSARLGASDPEDALLGIVADRYAALNAPQETAAISEAKAALRGVEQKARQLAADYKAGMFNGALRAHFANLAADLDLRKAEAEERLSALESPRVDITILLEGYARQAYDSADQPTRRDLVRLAVERVNVTKAPYKGARFDGAERVRIEWAESAA